MLDDVLIVAITGYGWESDQQRSAAAGIGHHVLKPCSVEQIVGLLGE